MELSCVSICCRHWRLAYIDFYRRFKSSFVFDTFYVRAQDFKFYTRQSQKVGKLYQAALWGFVSCLETHNY